MLITSLAQAGFWFLIDHVGFAGGGGPVGGLAFPCFFEMLERFWQKFGYIEIESWPLEFWAFQTDSRYISLSHCTLLHSANQQMLLFVYSPFCSSLGLPVNDRTW